MGKWWPAIMALLPPICGIRAWVRPAPWREMYEINRRTRAHVHIAHFKASGRADLGQSAGFVDNVRESPEGRIHVTVDLYPYLAAPLFWHHQFLPQVDHPGG